MWIPFRTSRHSTGLSHCLNWLPRAPRQPALRRLGRWWGAGVSITASSSNGIVQLANPRIDAADAVVVAGRCDALLDGKTIDCTSATLAADLKQQAADVNAN